MRRADGQSTPARVPVWRLLASFLRFGFASLLGDPMPGIERDLVALRRWLPEPAFRSLRALSRVAPGLPALSLAVVLGRRLGGWGGAVAALVGMLAVPAAAAILLGGVYAFGVDGAAGGPGSVLPGFDRRVDTVLAGVAAASAGVAFASGSGGLRRIGATPAVLLVVLFMTVALLIGHWPMALTVPAALVLSLLTARFGQKGATGHG